MLQVRNHSMLLATYSSSFLPEKLNCQAWQILFKCKCHIVKTNFDILKEKYEFSLFQ
jgi:hypothetical protein